jgi:hypothetical protein
MSAASEPAECGDVCPDEVSGRRLPAATALRVVVREDDLRRWAALCVETADYLASDVRTLPTEAAVQVLDTAGDAVRDAAVALWALRLEARRESA